MKSNKFLLAGILLLNIFLFTGCWDAVEINSRSFIMTIGIDKHVPETEEDSKLLRYDVTCGIADLKGSQNKDSKSGGGKKIIESISGNTLTDALNQLQSLSNKQTYLGDVKGIVISKELASDKDLFAELMDSIEREPLYSRKAILIISEEKAKDIIAKMPSEQPIIGVFLNDLFENNAERLSTFGKQHIGDVLIQLLESKGNALIPKIKTKGENLIVGGSAVIKDYKFIGWTSGEETKGILWISNKEKGGKIIIEYKDYLIPFNITDARSKLDFKMKDNVLECNIKIFDEGDFDEYKLGTGEQFFRTELMKDLEDRVSQKIITQIKDAVYIMQGKYEVDVANIKDNLRKNNYEIYKKVEKSWDETFKNMKFIINVDTRARRIGMTK